MSLEVYVAVLEADLGDPVLKNVLLGMANHAGPDGSHCYPSVRRLLAYTNLSDSTVRTKIKLARERGLLELVREAGRHRPNEYRMNLHYLIEIKHPIIRELDGEAPIYGGNQTSSSHRSNQVKTSSSQSETSESHNPDLQEPQSRPPRAGPEPSIEPSIEPSVNRGRFSKNDKTPLAQVKASLMRDLFGGQMYAKPPAEFERMYGALEMVSIEGSPPVVVLSHPERDLLLKDDRVLNPLLSAFVGVLGSEAEVKIEEAADDRA